MVVNVVEPGGAGGVYQHVLGRCQAEAGTSFIVHTSRDVEIQPQMPNVVFCRCMRWQRSGPHIFRALISLLWTATYLSAHILRSARPAAEWEVQGQFGRGAYALIILVLRLRRSRVVFVPHNLFSRHDRASEKLALWLSLRTCSAIAVFDESQRTSLGMPDVVLRQLNQYVPAPDEERIGAWRDRIGTSPFVLFAGQLRPDKNPEALIKAAGLLEDPPMIVFAGEDKGSALAIRTALAAEGVPHLLVVEYLGLDDLASLFAMASAVVCPYSVSSQSGVAALAKQLGTTVIATDVGALASQADILISAEPSRMVTDLAQVLREITAAGGR